jgi:hypothetical protein
MSESDLDYEVVNVDRGGGALPLNIFIVPALTSGEKLLAYGEQDIIKILARSSHRA